MERVAQSDKCSLQCAFNKTKTMDEKIKEIVFVNVQIFHQATWYWVKDPFLWTLGKHSLSQIFCSPWKYSVQDLLCLPEAVDPHEVGDAAEDDQEVSPGDCASPLDVANCETQ